MVPILPGVPRMNAIAERWMGTCRREATDRILITSERQLHLVVDGYAHHCNGRRPHRSLGQRSPNGLHAPPCPAEDEQPRIIRHDRLGGLIHEIHVGRTASDTGYRHPQDASPRPYCLTPPTPP
ncbi:integrase core domain-containing protein [Streptomyces sp. NPDC056983]|uniref:integrase core domain-containing protein n=1 Tax=Streptomyces sp. NPDC056983 TaxID=3345987 RepID=UPI003638C9CA